MHWQIINKEKTTQPKSGAYSDWKPILAEEGYYRCVYCAINDGRFGGIRNFHVEHYKPKSLFPDLTNIMGNLFYACAICNVFKSDDWHEPADNLDEICYPDPSSVNYSNLFKLEPDGTLSGLNSCGKYIINKLALNRNQLIIDRQFTLILNSYQHIKDEFRELRDKLMINNTEEAKEILRKMIAASDRVIDNKDYLYDAEPYKACDTKRPKDS